jgi:hypothetical protein
MLEPKPRLLSCQKARIVGNRGVIEPPTNPSKTATLENHEVHPDLGRVPPPRWPRALLGRCLSPNQGAWLANRPGSWAIEAGATRRPNLFGTATHDILEAPPDLVSFLAIEDWGQLGWFGRYRASCISFGGPSVSRHIGRYRVSGTGKREMSVSLHAVLREAPWRSSGAASPLARGECGGEDPWCSSNRVAGSGKEGRCGDAPLL